MLNAGARLGPYRIVRKLGAGGMGEVYLARDERLDRDAAVKVLPDEHRRDHTAQARFLREARAASALNHPNIITIYSTDTQQGTAYIAMEHVRGHTLAQLIRERALTYEEAVSYAAGIAEALAKAHAAGIVHRDLKPGNVMVTEDGLVKVLDFGLAKVASLLQHAGVGEQEPTGSTQTVSLLSMPGSTLGTLAYMSPEQARGDEVDARSDIFSFGVLFFEMLTRELPFAGANLLAVVHNLNFAPPRDPRAARPDLPENLVAVLDRCLRKLPEDRYQSAAEVVRDLRPGTMSNKYGSWPAREGNATAPLPMVSSPSVSSVGTSKSTPTVPRSQRSWRRTALLAGASLLAVISILAALHRRAALRASKPEAAAAAANPVGETAFALRTQAQVYLDRWDLADNVDRAIALLNRAIALDQNYPPAYASMAQAYYEKNRLHPDAQWARQAEQYAARALELNSDLADAHFAGGLAAMLAGKNAEAEQQFRKAADLDPKNPKPHSWLGLLYAQLGDNKQAEAEQKHALKLDPADWRAYMNLGLLYYKNDRLADATAAWEQVRKMAPDNFYALNNLAAVYLALGRDEDAASALQRSLEIKPAALNYSNLGTLRFTQGRYADAVPLFEKAVHLMAGNYVYWGNLADAYRWAPGQSGKAGPAYANAIRLAKDEIVRNPQDSELRSTLALYLAKSGDKQAALAELATVEPAKDQPGAVSLDSAVVYELCGDRERALAALSNALKAGIPLKEIETEPELVTLRAEARYQTMVASRSTQ